jgi:hypothetical protein
MEVGYVKKVNFLAAGVMAGLGASILGFGTGIAAADSVTPSDLVGKSLDDAESAISEAGLTSVVATRVGDKGGSCVVSSASMAPFNDIFGSHSEGEVLLNLNCYGASASGSPGYSAGNTRPDAQAVRDAEAEAAAESEAGVTSENER